MLPPQHLPPTSPPPHKPNQPTHCMPFSTLSVKQHMHTLPTLIAVSPSRVLLPGLLLRVGCVCSCVWPPECQPVDWGHGAHPRQPLAAGLPGSCHDNAAAAADRVCQHVLYATPAGAAAAAAAPTGAAGRGQPECWLRLRLRLRLGQGGERVPDSSSSDRHVFCACAQRRSRPRRSSWHGSGGVARHSDSRSPRHPSAATGRE